MNATTIWAVIVGMSLANFVIRFTPVAVLSRLELPDWLRRWLSYIPVSAMATLVVAEVVRPNGTWLSPLGNPYLWATVLTGLFYHKTRSFLLSTVVGIVLFLVFRTLLG